MSWSLSIKDAPGDCVYSDVEAEFDRLYPDPALGVRDQMEAAANVADTLAYSKAFGARADDDTLYKVQASGHVSDDDAESFVSVIVTQQKPQEALEVDENHTEERAGPKE